MKEIIYKLLKSITIIFAIFLLSEGMWWASFNYLFEYFHRDPSTMAISQSLPNGETISQRFIKGTSIKHGITKIFDSQGNLLGITNYNYGVLQESIQFDKENPHP